jgi:hypothetical protein
VRGGTPAVGRRAPGGAVVDRRVGEEDPPAADTVVDGRDYPRVPFRMNSIWSIDLVLTDRIGSRVIKSKPSMSDLAAEITYRFGVMLL